MKTRFSIFIVFICFVFAPSLGYTAAEKWDIDMGHSGIYFDARHTYATVRGYFDDFSGTFITDLKNTNDSRVEFSVNVDSINTNNTKRDNHLRSADFFDVQKYPNMTFKSNRVTHVKGNSYILEGDLTIKGITKRTTIPFTYYGVRENPLKKGQLVAGFEADFTINRLDYNVGTGKLYKIGAVANEVRIVIALEVLKEK